MHRIHNPELISKKTQPLGYCQTHLSNLSVVEATHFVGKVRIFQARKNRLSKGPWRPYIPLFYFKEQPLRNVSSILATKGDTHTATRSTMHKFFEYPTTQCQQCYNCCGTENRVVTPCLHPSCAIKWTGCTPAYPVLFIGSSICWYFASEPKLFHDIHRL